MYVYVVYTPRSSRSQHSRSLSLFSSIIHTRIDSTAAAGQRVFTGPREIYLRLSQLSHITENLFST